MAVRLPDMHASRGFLGRQDAELRARHGRHTMSETTASTDAQRSTPPHRCVNCATPLQTPLICGNCKQIGPVDGLSHFDLLGVPARFDLDVDRLRARYLELARAVHPDRFPNAVGDLAAICLRTNARLNEAFRVLSAPTSRAEYLLELAGGPSAADDKHVPQEVLAETLMLREEIDEARTAGDSATLERLRKTISAGRERYVDEVSAVARQLPGDDDQRRALRTALNALKYYDKMLEQL